MPQMKSPAPLVGGDGALQKVWNDRQRNHVARRAQARPLGEGAYSDRFGELPPELGTARITPQPDGTFRWGGEVDGVFLGVGGPDALEVPDIVVFDNVVAWRAEAPNRWWLEVFDWPILGWQALQNATMEGGSILLHATPAAWAARGGRGSGQDWLP